MTRRRRPHHAYRLGRSLALTRRIQEVYPDAVIRYIWYEDEPPLNSPIGWWDGSAYYWMTGPGKSWTAIGVSVHHARAWVASKRRAETGVKPPTLGEVMDVVGDVLGVIGIGAGIASDTRDLFSP